MGWDSRYAGLHIARIITGVVDSLTRRLCEKRNVGKVATLCTDGWVSTRDRWVVACHLGTMAMVHTGVCVVCAECIANAKVRLM